MKFYAKSVSILLVSMFIGSMMLCTVSNPEEKEPTILEEVEVVKKAVSPGHNVFLQYISSDNCYYCFVAGGGSESADNLKQSNPDEFVYITYQSADYSVTNDARSGNVAPIYAMNHLGEAGGAPTGYLGDSDPARGGCYGFQNGQCNGQAFDPPFEAGGYMASTVNDYQITVVQSVNSVDSANVDITMEASYVGSGSAPSTTVLYAAVTEEKCAYNYNDGSYGHNCWRAWLLNGNSYATQSGIVGGGNGFVTMNLNNGPHTETWTVPASLARSQGGQSGYANMLSIGAIFSGWSTSSHNEDVYAASDSSMGPKLELAVSSVSLLNAASPNSYKRGDQVTVSAIAQNIGGLDYYDGGNLEIIYMDGNTPVTVASKSISSLSVQGTISHTATVDTTAFSGNAMKTAFGARITGLTGDGLMNNNILVQELNHDRPPTAKQATVTGNNVIERGTVFTVVAGGNAEDYVDTINSLNFELEVSLAGQNDWDGSIDSGGDKIVNPTTSEEGREYTLSPTTSMVSGDYDLRSKATDSRGQSSDWRVTPNAFTLANGLPQIVAEPLPPAVTCDTATDIPMTPHISDPETALADLIIDSSNPYFVSWNPSSKSITVNFTYNEIQGCPTGLKTIEITVDDGAGYAAGNLPYGNLKFNVVENGQPRWLGLPTQYVDEQGSNSAGAIVLPAYVSDTTLDGKPSSSDDLIFEIISETNSDMISATINDGVLSFNTVGNDAQGQSKITVRACDLDADCSDQELIVMINPVNDAPVLDISPFEDLRLKAGIEELIDLKSLVSDVDNEIDDITIIVSSPDEPGGAQYFRSTGNLKLKFNDIGLKSVIITVVDKYASVDFSVTVDVYDSLEFTIVKSPVEDGFMVVEATNLYIGMIPYVNFYLTEDAPIFKSIEVRWQTCSAEGVCDGAWQYDLDINPSKRWETAMDIPFVGDPTGETLARGNGYNYGDYFLVMMDGVDEQNNNYKTSMSSAPKWTITESVPIPSEMSDEMLDNYSNSLKNKIADLQVSIEQETGDTTELEQELKNTEADLLFVCLDPRLVCDEDETSGSVTDGSKSGTDKTMIIVGIVSAIIIFSLLGGMFFMRGNRVEDNLGFKWADTTLPARDMTANSMYGGTQAIFQQQLSAPQYTQQPQQHYVSQTHAIHHASTQQITNQPVAPQMIPPVQLHRGPPLPPSGLPSGWTMAQWEYYGQQYLDKLNN